ncbi:MAG: hypothetical protein RLZZ476_476 [Verrucomicrobiota bacterium]|jgi:hypothetical protein
MMRVTKYAVEAIYLTVLTPEMGIASQERLKNRAVFI